MLPLQSISKMMSLRLDFLSCSSLAFACYFDLTPAVYINSIKSNCSVHAVIYIYCCVRSILLVQEALNVGQLLFESVVLCIELVMG